MTKSGRVGLLWFDNADKDLVTKITEGARSFRRKFGYLPNAVLVNIHVAAETETVDLKRTRGKVVVNPDGSTLPHHFLFYREDTDDEI